MRIPFFYRERMNVKKILQRSRVRRSFLKIVTAAILLLSGTSRPASACACGCGVFNVGTRWMMITGTGLRVFFQYSYMDQNRNWSRLSLAESSFNNDKEIRTSFYTLGFQYMFDRDWGIMGQFPYWDRYFNTIDNFGAPVSVDHKAIGDVRLLGMYTGFSPDMSKALLFGVKLPTGPTNLSIMDRDTQIGTGTTDLLLGGYHAAQLDYWGWYLQIMWRHALNTYQDYRPGDSYNMALGFHYDSFLQDSSGEDKYKFTPIVQLIASIRNRDSGANSDPSNTGFQRLYVAPGFEIDLKNNWQLYGEVQVPVYTLVNGYQLVALLLFNASISYHF
ncbi:MAG: hypothetical protein M1470_01855 [Bacteroidetes bacterium]|nr:hypothetical protein [Bacteroidota bacterium]MCL5737462.1 hypothetical protein [Bacteroidota bacterium]